MKRSKFSEEQIADALRQAGSDTPVGDVCWQLGVSEATFSPRRAPGAHAGPSTQAHGPASRAGASARRSRRALEHALRARCAGGWPPVSGPDATLGLWNDPVSLRDLVQFSLKRRSRLLIASRLDVPLAPAITDRDAQSPRALLAKLAAVVRLLPLRERPVEAEQSVARQSPRFPDCCA